VFQPKDLVDHLFIVWFLYCIHLGSLVKNITKETFPRERCFFLNFADLKEKKKKGNHELS